MDLIDAVEDIAEAVSRGRDAARVPHAIDLERRAHGLIPVAVALVSAAEASGLHPAGDEATRTRLAAALDRAADRLAEGGAHMDVVRGAHADFTIQEAAGLELRREGLVDPLAVISSRDTARRRTDPIGDLAELHHVDAAPMLEGAARRDLEALATGRFTDVRDAAVASGIDGLLHPERTRRGEGVTREASAQEAKEGDAR